MTDVDTPDAPFQLRDMAPRKRPRWLIPLIASAAVVVLAGGAVAALALKGDPKAKATASPSAALLTGEQSCERAFPLMQRVTDLLVTWTGSDPPSKQLLGQLRQELAELINASPEPIRTDLTYQRQAVTGAISGETPGPNLPTSSRKILEYCEQFGF